MMYVFVLARYLSITWALVLAAMVPQGVCEERPGGTRLSEPPEGLQQTLIDMPYGSVDRGQLVGNTDNQLGRRWLVEEFGQGELSMLRKSYPRFVPYWNQHFAPGSWDNQLTCLVDRGAEYRGLFGHVFPRWRASHGQLAFFCSRGFRTRPMDINYGGGFFLFPYGARDPELRRPWGEIAAMRPEDAKRFAERKVNSRRELATAAYVFKSSPRAPILDDHRLAFGLHDGACAGLDFAISDDGTGLFFFIERVNHVRWIRDKFIKAPDPENLPSKMIILDYRMREEKGWIPEIDRSGTEAAGPKALPPAPPRPKPATEHDKEEVIVGMHAPGVFGASLGSYDSPPDSVVSLRWTEKETFEVPFSVPFTAAVDGDDYFFVTNDGRIYRASPAKADDAERRVERVFDNADDPVIACIHESSTNRIFAFRRNSYILVDKAHFPEDGRPQFESCEDVTQPKAMTYLDEDQTVRTPDERFQLVSRCANVLYKDGVLEPM